MSKNIFEEKSYKDYLRHRTGGLGSKTGIKSALAKAMSCQPTYLSQVLHGNAHLSLEQAEKLNEFFEHTSEEALFLLLLVQKDRAGTHTLKKFFNDQMSEVHKRRLILTQRLEKKESLSGEDQARYYSSWIYAAVHIALTLPELRTREALGSYLNVPVKRVTEALEFLISIGLVKQNGSSYIVGNAHIRLGNDSHNIIKHHTNWRNQAIESLDREQVTDLHYSGVVSLSAADVVKIKNLFLDAIQESQKIVKDSKEETLSVINLDFFSLQK